MRRLERAALGWLVSILLLIAAGTVQAAPPTAAMVMDARTGKVLHSRSADTRLHPASLTKMMTLYVVFDAVERGEISLDTVVKISKKAASEPPSKLGLRPGQKIKLRYLIRAAAVKSANDAATALAEAVSESEAQFARRMNRTAKALGMSRTHFKNAHGLTETGHMSTARDMTLLGRHLLYNHDEYYNLFSRRSADTGVGKVSNTNRRFLDSYRGADGIKTGYTRAAGFNLVASAERGQERIIVTYFGGRSSAQRNAKVSELMDLGFRRAPSRAAVQKPNKPSVSTVPPSHGSLVGSVRSTGKTLRVSGAVQSSMRPAPRPSPEVPQNGLVAMNDKIKDAVLALQSEGEAAAVLGSLVPVPRAKPQTGPSRGGDGGQDFVFAPPARPDLDGDAARVVVTRLSTSDGRHWGINVGRFTTRDRAERMLLTTALADIGTLDLALRKVNSSAVGHDANFLGLTKDAAERACARLSVRSITCKTIGPG